MDLSRYTNKSQEALQAANALAVEYGHQELTPVHVLLAMLRQDKGVVPALIAKAGVDARALDAAFEERLQRLPKVSGDGASQAYVGRALTGVMSEAVKTAGRMKDDFVSVEHLLLACLEKDSECREAAGSVGLDAKRVLENLKSVRGSQRVTSSDPEGTFDALEKYCRDLTQMAGQNKLDPVIGRDEEIRRIIQILSRRT